MNKLKQQIEYAKFFHTNQVSLDLKYAEELLEREIPKKPIKIIGLDHMCCPTCKKEKDNVYAKNSYCQHCGQHLDWSIEETKDALNNIRLQMLNCENCKGDKDNIHLNILQELINQQKTPTLEEVKKEWEELGYTIKKCENNNIKFYFSSKLEFGLDLETEEFIFVNKRIFELDEIQLLTKTFKALGWETTDETNISPTE